MKLSDINSWTPAEKAESAYQSAMDAAEREWEANAPFRKREAMEKVCETKWHRDHLETHQEWMASYLATLCAHVDGALTEVPLNGMNNVREMVRAVLKIRDCLAEEALEEIE